MLKRFFIIGLLFTNITTHAQFIRAKQVSFSIGNQGVYSQKNQSASNLNFLNHIYTDNFTGELLYIAFSGNFEFSNSMYLNMVVGMFSDLAPVKYNFALSYLPLRHFGIGASFLGYSQYVNDFNLYHWENDVGMIADLDQNYRQKSIYNMGMAVGPEFRFEKDWFTANIRTHMGLRWVSELDTKIIQKEINGNFKRMYEYKVGNNPNPYLLSEVELRLKVLRLSKSTMGVKIRAAAEFSSRTLNYQRTTYEWTAENSTVENISFNPRRYSTVETDLGLYLQW